jgi:ABC-type transport system involved in multi-copper enzyme maturation permease subunit
MKTIISIAKNTFRETIRDRVLYVILVFALLLIVSTVFLGSISLDQDIKVIKDLGLAGIFIFGIIIAMFVGTSLVHKELDKRTVFLIFPKPVAKYQFVLGKFLGIATTLFWITLAMSIVFFIVLAFKKTTPDLILLEAISWGWLELLVIAAISIMFSALTSPIASTIYTISLFVIGHSLNSLQYLINQLEPGFLTGLLRFVYYLFPNFEKFNIRNSAIAGVGISGEQVAYTILYAVAYIVLTLAIANFLLKKQEY